MPSTSSQLWTARILGGIAVLFLLFDTVIHLIPNQQVLDAFTELGFPPHLSVTLGVIELIGLILYLLPQTSVLGAIIWTGYLGGAIATHVRVGNPLFSHTLFPVYIAVLLWAGIFLRDGRVRELIPIKK